jgi:peptide/nickel transport system substrate-binding protein
LNSARAIALVASIAALCSDASAEDLLTIQGLAGRPGGNLVYAQRTEPRTLNPLIATDAPSREVIPRLMADLIHINRFTQKTEPALARRWTVSPDGRRFVLELRQGVRFSDGSPFDADDVLFTFRVYLDERVNAAQRDQLIQNGRPVVVRKLDAYLVSFELPEANAVAERLFDGFYILPRRLLSKAYEAGKLGEAWGLRAPPAEIAGLGPFRLKSYAPGQRLVLERNPYYWKQDSVGNRLPYLAELTFEFAGSEDAQAMRFEAGESDLITRVSARNYAVLTRSAAARGLRLENLGAGLEYNFLLFNLNDTSRTPGNLEPQLRTLRRRSFRAAVSAAIDRDAIVRLVYLGYAASLASLVPPGNKAWVDERRGKPARDLSLARKLLTADGFRWAPDGRLLDAAGTRAAFTIAVSASSPERQQMATLIQDDLKALGIEVQVAPLEFRSLLDRVQRTFDYEAAVMGLASADADPNADLNVWLSSGATHLWHPSQKRPATEWEAEIDALMRKQLVMRDPAERKRLFHRVLAILATELPMAPLASPNVLVGARASLGNFRPAILDHSTLWNAEGLFWREAAGGRRQ